MCCSYTWANELCAGDNEERSIVISSMNNFQYAVAAWLPIVIFPQTMAPTFRRGFPGTFGLVIAALISIIAIQLLHMCFLKKAKSREPSLSDRADEESGVGETFSAISKDVGKSSKAREVDVPI